MKRNGHFAVLDGLRGIAAFSVLTMHIGEILILPNILPQAYLAVPFFFVLSGFVVSYAYEDGLMRRASVIGFMAVRIERLYPMLIAGLAIGVTFAIFRAVAKHASFNTPEMIITLVTAILMLPRPGPSAFKILPPQWSLALEFWGNLLHYFLRPFLTLGVLVTVLPFGFAAMAWGAFHYGGLGTGWSLANILGGVATFAFSYCAGVLIFRLWKIDQLPSVRIPLWGIIVLLIVTLAVPQTLRTSANSVRDLVCATLLYPLILVASLQAKSNPKIIGAATWLGRLSYPIYIVHYPIVTILAFALIRLKTPMWAMFLAVPLVAALATLAAWALLAWVDEPFRGWAKRVRNSRLRAKPGPDLLSGEKPLR